MDEVIEFRNKLAENGFEYTPKKAKKILSSLKKFKSMIENQEPEFFEDIAKMDEKEVQMKCREFANLGKEVTPNEVRDLIGLILSCKE